MKLFFVDVVEFVVERVVGYGYLCFDQWDVGFGVVIQVIWGWQCWCVGDGGQGGGVQFFGVWCYVDWGQIDDVDVVDFGDGYVGDVVVYGGEVGGGDEDGGGQCEQVWCFYGGFFLVILWIGVVVNYNIIF